MIVDRPDAEVVNQEGRTVLVAEAKSRFDTTGTWAAGTFRNLYAHGSLPDVPYFLLALPDTFYLWQNPAEKATKAFLEGHQTVLGEPKVEPDYSVPAWEIVRRYLKDPSGNEPNPHEVSSYAMSMVLGAFLADIINARNLTRDNAPSELWWLFDSGLYDAMRGGSFAGAVAG